MNNQEAKFILSAYRANGADANEPLFADALKQTNQDPALGAWFAREQAHDRAMVEKLASLQPPAGLRDAILMGSRVSGRKTSGWKGGLWLATSLAAAVLIVVTASFWPKRSAANEGQLATFALKDAIGEKHDVHGAEVKALQTILADPNLKLGRGLAVDFEAMRGSGCRTIAMGGREVFEVCFNRNGAWFHLYAMREAAPAGVTSGGMVLEKSDKLACATWSDPVKGYRYAVVGDAGLDAVKNLL
ncbi:MAG: hypothetical protein ABIZ04_22450 [Opitutus sp.]